MQQSSSLIRINLTRDEIKALKHQAIERDSTIADMLAKAARAAYGLGGTRNGKGVSRNGKSVRSR